MQQMALGDDNCVPAFLSLRNVKYVALRGTVSSQWRHEDDWNEVAHQAWLIAGAVYVEMEQITDSTHIIDGGHE